VRAPVFAPTFARLRGKDRGHAWQAEYNGGEDRPQHFPSGLLTSCRNHPLNQKRPNLVQPLLSEAPDNRALQVLDFAFFFFFFVAITSSNVTPYPLKNSGLSGMNTT